MIVLVGADEIVTVVEVGTTVIEGVAVVELEINVDEVSVAVVGV